jgi:mannose-6-phosphate isomerase
MSGNIPFLLKPAAKDYLWGGRRLNDEFNKGIDVYPLAETWECSTHPDGMSLVASGTDAGKPLIEVLREHPDYLGTHPLQIMSGKPELPVLIKLIDATQDMSVQVHPDDAYALENENSLGKTEMWYVLAARKGASLVYGFNQDMEEEQVRKSLVDGTIDKFLNHVQVRGNDVFFVEAGTVHAIGAGIIMAEIQESSNLTYRLYDYGRVDRNGKQRELHVEKALQVMNMHSSAPPRQPMRVLRYKRGCACELLTRCKYFQVERLLLNTDIYGLSLDYKTGSNSFQVLLCTEGRGFLSGENFSLSIGKGDSVFVPAESIPLKLSGKAQLLKVSC